MNYRRLQNWGGSPHPTIGMVPEPIPQVTAIYIVDIQLQIIQL